MTIRPSGSANIGVFNISAGVVTISGLVVSNGSSNNCSSGSGINISNNSNVTLTNVVVSNNLIGSSIRIIDATLTITNSTISNNRSSCDGAGISIINSFLSLRDSTISGNNIATGNGNGGGLSVINNSSIVVINSTISGNTASLSGGGLSVIGSFARLINVTIAENIAIGGQGGGISKVSIIATIGNTIIARNSGINPDVSGSFASLGHNLIGDGTGSTGFTNGINGDQVGTTTIPINPRLQPLSFNSGPTQTMALIFGSPAINTGDNALKPSDFDQRGSPYVRIFPIGSTIDIGAFELQPQGGGGGICYASKSKILVRNISSGKISAMNAEDVITGTHEVFNTSNKCFVPIKYNIVSGLVNEFYLLRKNALGKNQPYEDFYVTGGHMLMINGKEVKARNIPQAIRIPVKQQNVYSICTDQKCPILVNGLNVMTWGYDKWTTYYKNRGIYWTDNKAKLNNNSLQKISAVPNPFIPSKKNINYKQYHIFSKNKYNESNKKSFIGC